MLSLLDAALEVEETTHVLFCTESCVPVATLREVARAVLWDEACPWMEARDRIDVRSEGGENEKDGDVGRDGGAERSARPLDPRPPSSLDGLDLWPAFGRVCPPPGSVLPHHPVPRRRDGGGRGSVPAVPDVRAVGQGHEGSPGLGAPAVVRQEGLCGGCEGLRQGLRPGGGRGGQRL
ncbi:hypothetical protein ACHAWF_000399, partial [Thalassiosira exigua]